MTEAENKPCRFCGRNVQPYGYYKATGTCRGCVQCSTYPAAGVRAALHNLHWAAQDEFRAGTLPAETYSEIHAAYYHNDPRKLPQAWKDQFLKKYARYGYDRFC